MVGNILGGLTNAAAAEELLSAIADDGRTPLAAPGLKLKARLDAVAASLDRVAAKRRFSAPLARLRHLIGRGLERTAPLWPDVERAYAWVHAAARVLGNDKGENAATVQRRFDGLVGAMRRHRDRAGALAPAIDHFVKVTRSYRPRLFHCCAVPGLPRTNNGLEQLFGSQRYHERRATGRRAASPAAVLRGEVQLIAATATRIHPPAGVNWAALTGRRGANCANTSTSAGTHGRYAPASAATQMPTWPSWNSKSGS